MLSAKAEESASISPPCVVAMDRYNLSSANRSWSIYARRTKPRISSPPEPKPSHSVVRITNHHLRRQTFLRPWSTVALSSSQANPALLYFWSLWSYTTPSLSMHKPNSNSRVGNRVSLLSIPSWMYEGQTQSLSTLWAKKMVLELSMPPRTHTHAHSPYWQINQLISYTNIHSRNGHFKILFQILASSYHNCIAFHLRTILCPKAEVPYAGASKYPNPNTEVPDPKSKDVKAEDFSSFVRMNKLKAKGPMSPTSSKPKAPKILQVEAKDIARQRPKAEDTSHLL